MTEEETKEEPPQEGRIHFCTVNVRLYPTIIGNNPATFRGPALEMAWKPKEQMVYSVDEYEKHRIPGRRNKFVLAPGTRRRFLKGIGFSDEEIEDSEVLIQQDRKLRQESIARMDYDKKDLHREERQEYINRVFFCRPVEVLDYPDVPDPGKKNPYYNEHNKVKPMFDKIPCTHCSSFACVGEGSDWPAVVTMFKCDGKYCKEVNVKICPVTGQKITGVGYRRSSIFNLSTKLDPKPDLEPTMSSQEDLISPELEVPSPSRSKENVSVDV